MPVLNSIHKGISEFTGIIGTGLKYGGAGSLFVMAAVGTVAIDLVVLFYAEKQRDIFLTGFILGSMFSSGRVDPLPLLIVSPITSVIAVCLSFALGVSGVGMAILAGWAVAATLLAVGFGLEALAKETHPEPDYSPGFAF